MTASSSTSPLRAVKFSRLPRRVVLLGLTATQLATIAAGIVPVIGAVYTGTGLLVVVPLAVIAVAAALVPAGGQPLVAWAPVIASWAWRTLTGQRRFYARLTRPRPAGTLALPGRPASLRLVEDRLTGAALIHDPHAATLTVLIPTASDGYTLLDPADQARRAAGWGRVLATVCRSPNLAGLTVTERTLPGAGASLSDWWHAHGVADESLPARIYAELIDRAGPTAERHQTTIALRLDMRAAHRPIRAAGGGLPGAAAVLRQETETLIAALHSADLRAAAPLDPHSLAVWLRTGYDPTLTPLLEQHPDTGRDLATAGPIALSETWSSLRCDASWHTTLWISQWPQSPAYPGFLAPLLLTSGIGRTLTVTFEPVPADAAARDLRRKRTSHLTETARRAKSGQLDNAVQNAEYDDLLVQEADLAAGHGILRATGLITISAPDPEALEHDVAAVEQAAIQAGCETRRLWGQQAAAFPASLGLDATA